MTCFGQWVLRAAAGPGMGRIACKTRVTRLPVEGEALWRERSVIGLQVQDRG